MVASGQMVTLDSPGSIVMKWSTPLLQIAKLKHLKFFSGSPFLIIFLEKWIKGYVKEHKPPLK